MSIMSDLFCAGFQVLNYFLSVFILILEIIASSCHIVPKTTIDFSFIIFKCRTYFM